MPELAELRIMSDYINKVVSEKSFINIRKSEVSKVKTDLGNPFGEIPFLIEADSRGKELCLELSSESHFPHYMICMMGMSGNWNFTRTGEEVKHTHLMFDTLDGYTLGLVDPRRFAKWKWGGWGKNRGPCPVIEHEMFRSNILDNIESKFFEKPILEIMMDQRYFNGIGNYLRAEILDRSGIDPFLPARKAILDAQETKGSRPQWSQDILDLCKTIPEEVYELGGGELKDWVNPENEKPQDKFKEWLQCYRKKESMIDSKGRKFWFDKKFKESYENTY